MTLKKHATSLAVMHAADVLQPLIILPFAARILEPSHFGKFALTLSISQIAATLVGYGFHWTAQRAVAAARNEPSTVAAIFAEVTTAKILLFTAVAVAGLSASSLLGIEAPFFLCALLTAAGDVIFPAWLLIGLERAWQVAIAVVVARALALVSFFVLVTSPADVLPAVATQTSITLVSGLVGLPFVAAVGFRGFRSITISDVISRLAKDWRGFLFTLVETAMLTLPVPIVAQLSGYVAAGQYSVALKFISATRPFLRIVSETFLPRVSYYARHDPSSGVLLVRNSLLTVVIGAAISLLLYFVAPSFILIFFGESYSGAIPIVRVLSIIPFLANINVCTSNLYMFAFGHERAWAYLSVSGLLLFLAAAYGLALWGGNASSSVAVAAVIRESFVLVVSASFFILFGFNTVGSGDNAVKRPSRHADTSNVPAVARAAASRPSTTT